MLILTELGYSVFTKMINNCNITNNMPTAISKDTKNNVFHQWLKGKSRDEMAYRNSISTGAVSTLLKNGEII